MGDTDMPDTTASVRLRPKLILMLMLTLSLRSLLDSPSIMPLLPDMPTMLEYSPEPPMLPQLMLDTVHTLLPPTPDIPVLDMLDMLDMLVMLDLDTPVLLDTDTPVLLHLDTDMLDTMASVRLKLMLIPLVRLLMDSPSITPTLPDMATMLELSPDTDLMLLPPTPGMLVLDML